ncbi:MAG: hypothetical protein LC753_20565, partial [Acidobacteria bacterium]|nr:hypothetical protein [Acidobacteriota bacterium]
VWSSNSTVESPLLGFVADPTSPSGARAVFGPPQTISGFRLLDSRASYGFGLETFALGFPIHFDWSWRTLFNRNWEDILFAQQGIQEGMAGSKWFRKAKFAMWIGYDF